PTAWQQAKYAQACYGAVKAASGQEPPLVLVQVELLDGNGFRHLAIRRFDRADMFAFAAHDDGRLSPSITCTAKPSRSPRPQGLENLHASAGDAPRCM